MPPAKKPASQARRRSPATFTELAALTQLTKSLDAAQVALAELRKDTGRDVSQGARDLYNDLRTFLTSASERVKLRRKVLIADGDAGKPVSAVDVALSGLSTSRRREPRSPSREADRAAPERSRARTPSAPPPEAAEPEAAINPLGRPTCSAPRSGPIVCSSMIPRV